MRVRSSSAPTVRSRPNQRALSMARAAGSTKPVEELDVALGEVVRRRRARATMQPDGGAAGREHARRGPERELGSRPGPPPASEVRARWPVLRTAHRAGERAAGGRPSASVARRPGALAADGVPPPVGVVEEDDGHGVGVEELAELVHRGVEHLGRGRARRAASG